MNKQQQAQALISKFLQEHEARYDFRPVINRYKVKWGMVDVIDSIGYDRARELIEYYFRCEADHTVEGFMNNFDQLDDMDKKQRADKEKRARLREQTRERMRQLER